MSQASGTSDVTSTYECLYCGYCTIAPSHPVTCEECGRQSMQDRAVPLE